MKRLLSTIVVAFIILTITFASAEITPASNVIKEVAEESSHNNEAIDLSSLKITKGVLEADFMTRFFDHLYSKVGSLRQFYETQSGYFLGMQAAESLIVAAENGIDGNEAAELFNSGIKKIAISSDYLYGVLANKDLVFVLQYKNTSSSDSIYKWSYIRMPDATQYIDQLFQLVAGEDLILESKEADDDQYQVFLRTVFSYQ